MPDTPFPTAPFPNESSTSSAAAPLPGASTAGSSSGSAAGSSAASTMGSTADTAQWPLGAEPATVAPEPARSMPQNPGRLDPPAAAQTWESEGGGNAQWQPQAELPEPLLAFVDEHPLLAAAAAFAAGALAVSALSAAAPRSHRSANGERDGTEKLPRRSRRARRALLDEVAHTTRSILRAMNDRAESVANR